MLRKLESSPALLRAVPFVIFLALTGIQGSFGEAGRYWIYLAKTLVGAALLVWMWPRVEEMRWNISWKAVLVGVAVCVMWVGLDPLYPKLDVVMAKVGLAKAPTAPTPDWNPHVQFGTASALAWFFIAVRLLGSALVVPPLEEVFFRSLVYRWIVNQDFLKVSLGLFKWTPFLLTSLIFGLEHHQWLAGILCGFAYQGLVLWTKRLGDAIVAHAITNALLAGWVIWRGDWQFW